MLKIIKDSTLVPTPIVDLKLDSEPRQGSTDPVTSDGVKSAIDGAVGDASEALQQQIDDIAEKAGSGYIPKGEATVATLNALSGQENGDLYTMTDAGTLTDGSLAVVAGDTVAWDATNEVWYKAMDYAPRQYGTNEVHNITTTITSFRTGDVIAVDGPSGTAKMGKDDLLKETAENAAASGIVAIPDDFDLVMDGLERSISLSTTAGQDWNADLNIIVLPGKRCSLSSVRDTSIADASGTFIAYYTDGSSSSVGSSWAGYGYTFTNNTTKTIYRIRYHFASTAIVGNGSASFTAKVYSLAGDILPTIKRELAENGIIVEQNQEFSGWSFSSGYLDANGDVVANVNYVYSDYISAFGNSDYTLVAGGQMFFTNQPVFFYNEEKTIIGKYTTNTTDTTRSFTTPSGTRYIRYSCYGNGNNSSITYTSADTKNLSDELNTIASKKIDKESASIKYPIKDLFSIVMDDFNKSVTVPTIAGQAWDAYIDVVVLPSVKVLLSSVTDGSITSTSGTFIAYYTDGSTANVGSSWPGYGYSFTNNTTKTISRLRYHFNGTNVTGSGSVQFSVKYPSLAGGILPEVKSELAYNGIICSQGQETSGWTFTSGAFLHKDGTTEALAGYVTSDFIRVFPSSQYSIVEGGQTFGNNQPIVFYNAKKNVIGYVDTGTTNNTPISFATPKGCEFIRYSCYGNGNNSKLTYIGVNDASLSERVGELECPIESIPIPTIYGVVGKNITLWLDALFRVSPRENFACHLQSGRGAMQMRNALDVDVSSTYSATTKIRWYGNNGTIVLENNVPVKVVASNSKSGQSKKVMVIGDSLTNIGKITSYLLQNFEGDVMSIELLGTMGTAPNLREGRGGWSSYDYTHTASYNSYTNAFLNDGVFDFGYYLTQNSIATPDIVVIELGTNDNWRPRNGTTTHENIEEMITSIKASNPSVQIIVMTPQCPYIGFDASVGDTYYSRFDLWAIAKEIVEYFGGRTDENIFVSLMGGILNPIYSFPRTEVQACPYSTETISKCTDRIHPLDCGYQQIADELYCAIKGI